MKLNNVIIDSKKMIQNAILINANPYYEYINGVKQERLEGTRFEVVLENIEFEKVQIKIKNVFIEEKDILKKKLVYFKNLELKLRMDYKSNTIICYGEAEEMSQEKEYSELSNIKVGGNKNETNNK